MAVAYIYVCSGKECELLRRGWQTKLLKMTVQCCQVSRPNSYNLWRWTSERAKVVVTEGMF